MLMMRKRHQHQLRAPRLTKKGKPDKRFLKSADNAKKAREVLAAKRKAEADDGDDEAPKKSKRVTKKDIENNKQEEMAEKLRLLQAQVDSYKPKLAKNKVEKEEPEHDDEQTGSKPIPIPDSKKKVVANTIRNKILMSFDWD